MSFDFALDPYINLEEQIRFADSCGVKEPTAMSLATATKSGLPSVRAVLFKGLAHDGITFYTNYESAKSSDLEENPKAEVLFFWAPIFQQIRISGSVYKLSREESERYFSVRPRLSQIGAWASVQSQKISNFDELAKKVEDFEKKFEGREIPCPPNWGGYYLVPNRFEFWFGKEGRLHERYVYTRNSPKENWERSLLSP